MRHASLSGATPGTPDDRATAHRVFQAAPFVAVPNTHDDEQSERDVAMMCRMYDRRTRAALAHCPPARSSRGLGGRRADGARRRRARAARALGARSRPGRARGLPSPARRSGAGAERLHRGRARAPARALRRAAGSRARSLAHLRAGNGEDALARAGDRVASCARGHARADRLRARLARRCPLARARGVRRAPAQLSLRQPSPSEWAATGDRVSQAEAEGDPAPSARRGARLDPAHDAAHGFTRGRSAVTQRAAMSART